jgi:hypothetical protein
VNGEIEAPILIIDRISDLERVLKRTKVVLTHTLCSSIPYKRFSIITFKMVFEHKNGENHTT